MSLEGYGSRCDDCGHDVDTHDVRGYDSTSKCIDMCETCVHAKWGDSTYAEALASMVDRMMRASSIVGERVA